jgi:hypothetical protein
MEDLIYLVDDLNSVDIIAKDKGIIKKLLKDAE